MKYILAETVKHILNEKYLLDERYILNEATTTDMIKKIVEEINKVLPNTKTALYNLKSKIEINNDETASLD